MKILNETLMWVGFAGIVFGCWLIYQPLAFIIGGLGLFAVGAGSAWRG